jgi:hypothetical protein
MGKLIAVDVKQLKGWEVKASLHHSVKDNGYAVTITCNEGEHYNSRQVRFLTYFLSPIFQSCNDFTHIISFCRLCGILQFPVIWNSDMFEF